MGSGGQREWSRGTPARGLRGARGAALVARAFAGRLSDARSRALRRALDELGLARVARLGAGGLVLECGLTRTQANALSAMFELGREVERWEAGPGARVESPADAVRLLAPELRGLAVESFRVLVLDVRRRPIAHEEVSRGTLDAALVHPREVFGPALRAGGATILVAHNHPSGDPEPSPQDWTVTERLVRAGGILGVPVSDHLVLGGRSWVSMRSRDRWPAAARRGWEGRASRSSAAGEDPGENVRRPEENVRRKGLAGNL